MRNIDTEAKEMFYWKVKYIQEERLNVLAEMKLSKYLQFTKESNIYKYFILDEENRMFTSI